MHRLLEWAQLISYIAIGLVTIGTALRVLFRVLKQYDNNAVFVQELKDVYLKDIYEALRIIAARLDVEIYLTPPGQ